ncbi:MAG: phosphoadenosine phosphosulfate reductase family protein [Candidatus Gastranaerophilales bacterium]
MKKIISNSKKTTVEKQIPALTNTIRSEATQIDFNKSTTQKQDFNSINKIWSEAQRATPEGQDTKAQKLDCHAHARNDVKVHHILSLSGGKDSTALAFFMKENNPEIFERMELVFCDTECEIPETYDYLNKIEVFLNKKITRLKPEKSFDHLYQTRKFLPSIVNRWCTVELKINVYKKYIDKKLKNISPDAIIKTYVGIRADELGRGLSTEKNDKLKTIFPFQEFGICKSDVEDILVNNGIGYSDYYKWRKRSGCYFCFYQSKMDWINLYENHPELYFKAMQYEKDNEDGSKLYGFNIDMRLSDIIKSENIIKIKEDYARKNKICKKVSICNLISYF